MPLAEGGHRLSGGANGFVRNQRSSALDKVARVVNEDDVATSVVKQTCTWAATRVFRQDTPVAIKSWCNNFGVGVFV